MEKLLSDPTSLIAWIVLAFLIIKDIYFWIKNKGIPSFETTVKKIDDMSNKLEKLQFCNDQVKTQIANLQADLDELYKLDKEFQIIIKELYQWHNVTNDEGVKLWYIRPSFEKTLEKLKEAIDTQTNLTKEMVNNLNSLRKELREDK